MNLKSRLQLGELPSVPRWLEIACGVCLALMGAVIAAGMVWGRW